MAGKKTILIVEDDAGLNDIALYIAQKQFPKEHYDVVVAVDLTGAMEVICDPNRTIGAVIIDNGFPLTRGGDRFGAVRTDPSGVQATVEEMDARQKEGGAGAMLLRFMRTGDLGALSTQSIIETQGLLEKALDALGNAYTERLEQLRITYAVWNSADPRQNKIEGIRALIAGEDMDLSDPRFGKKNDSVKLAKNSVEWLDDGCTACAGKTFRQIFEALSEKLAKQELDVPEYTLCAEHGKKPGPETEFSLAVQYHRSDILREIYSKHHDEISAPRINSAIGMLSVSPHKEILDLITTFPRFDANAFYILPMSAPERAIRPLYEAVHYGADMVVEKLLATPNIEVTRDIIDLAKARDSDKVQNLLAPWEIKLSVGTSVSDQVDSLENVRKGAEVRAGTDIPVIGGDL